MMKTENETFMPVPNAFWQEQETIFGHCAVYVRCDTVIPLHTQPHQEPAIFYGIPGPTDINV